MLIYVRLTISPLVGAVQRQSHPIDMIMMTVINYSILTRLTPREDCDTFSRRESFKSCSTGTTPQKYSAEEWEGSARHNVQYVRAGQNAQGTMKMTSGMLRRVVWYPFTDVSEVFTAYITRGMSNPLHGSTSHKTVMFIITAVTT
jgi:hypothetical protein